MPRASLQSKKWLNFQKKISINKGSPICPNWMRNDGGGGGDKKKLLWEPKVPSVWVLSPPPPPSLQLRQIRVITRSHTPHPTSCTNYTAFARYNIVLFLTFLSTPPPSHRSSLSTPPPSHRSSHKKKTYCSYGFTSWIIPIPHPTLQVRAPGWDSSRRTC